MTSLVETAKSAAKAALRHHYARNHIRAARAKLAGLEAMYGPLNPADARRCDAYATEVLGHARYAPWLYVYAHVAGEFREGWIPDNFYDERVLPQTSGEYGELSGYRSLNTVLFDAAEFPDIVASINGMFMARDGRIIPETQLPEILFQQSDQVIFKSDASQSGIGITVLGRDDFDLARVRRLGSGLFQRFVRQHELFQRLGNCPAVATLRLTTVAEDQGRISLRGAHLRFGQGSGVFLRTAEEVNAVVDRKTGDLAPLAFLPDWKRADRHPQSDLPFAGHSVPNYQACLDAALRCHARIPYVRCIGWDITVDDEGGVHILEWNGGHNGIKFSEATQGPCFADLNWQRFRPE
jgi:hypothetical protein